VRPLRFVPTALVGGVLLIAGCGDDGDGSGGGGDVTGGREPQTTKLTATHDRLPPNVFIHGEMQSSTEECLGGRQVAVFRQEPGDDRLLATFRIDTGGGRAAWGGYVREAEAGWRIYAEVERMEIDDLACLADRSPTFTVVGPSS